MDRTTDGTDVEIEEYKILSGIWSNTPTKQKRKEHERCQSKNPL